MVVEILRHIRKHGTPALLGAAAVLLTGATASAAVLSPGGTLFPAPGEPDPTGGVVVATQTIPFAIPGFFDGSLTSTVIRGDTTNPFGANALTFTYQLTNASSSPNAMARLTVDDFTGFQTDASFETPSAGVAPTLIDRNTPDVIGFSFQQIGPGPLFPGTNSATLVVQTNAQGFRPTLANIIDSAAITVPSFSPIPEPATLGLAAFGALALVRRRR